MSELGTAKHVLEQLVSHRTDICFAIGDYATASDSVLAWFAAGSPTSPEDIANLGPATQDACAAVMRLEQRVVEVANSIRASGTSDVPPTVGARELRA